MVLSIKKSDFLLFLVLILCVLNYAGVSAQVTDFVMGDANESTFASGLQLATIAIDASKFTAGNVQFTSTITSGTAASYSRSDGIVSYKEVTVNENEFRDGGSFTVTYKDAAIMSDGTRRDLVIEFSGIRIASKNDIGSYVDTQRVFQAQQNGKLRVYGNSSARIHFGYRIDSAKMYVAGVGSGDTFFFTMYGVNQQRNTGNGSQNFAKLNGAADNQNYSEQIQILSGNQSSIYIPSNSLMSRLETAGVFNGIFLANGGGNWTYQTGLAVIADVAGLVFKIWQDAPGSTGTTDFYLMPDGITHTITSSSGSGGTIKTGKSGNGTDLDGGTYTGSGIPTSLFTSPAYAGLGPKMYDVANGKSVTYTMTPDAGYFLDTLYIDGASAAAEPHYENGKLAYYTYTFPANTTGDRTIHVTWKQSVQIDFEKLWDDYNNAMGKRPDDISITLRGGNVSETVSVSGSDNWKHTFYDLPRYEANGTTEIDYIILENTVLDGYQEQTSHNVVTTQENPKIISYTITNTIEPVYVEITVIKEWDEDEHSASIEVNLLRDGTQVDSVTLPYNNEWAYTFTNKPKYDTSGNEYEYTVEESFIGSDAYDSEISEAPAEDVSGSDSNQKTFTITNTRKKTRVDVTKVWEDEDSQQRPSYIDLILKQNGTEYASAQINERVSWQHSFTDLPAYDFEGNAYDYTVEESFEGPYSSETEQTEIDGVISFTITNTLIEETVDIEVRKIWEDGDDPNRPQNIQIQLLRNGAAVNTTTLSARDNWTHTFHDLPRKDAEGNAYAYTVAENFAAMDSYTGSLEEDRDGNLLIFTFTNQLNVSAGFLPVRKIIEGSLPDPADTYTFRLEAKTAGAPMPEGAVNGVKTVTISSNASPRTAEFGTILFEGDGTFEYRISEENAAGASYTYDPSVYTVIWTVTDGKAVSSVQLNGNAYSGAEFIFTNVYELPEGWAEPQVLKQITGIQPNPEETYTFRLHPITPGAPMPEGTSSDGNKYITITGSRAAKFGPVQFTKDGSYEYRIREVKGTNTSAVYDETEYRTVVTVANGKITKRVWKNGTEIPFAHNTYEFTNVYPERNPEVEPIIRKVVRDGTPNPGDKFYFTLKATGKPDGVDTYPMPVFSDDETTKTISINGDDIVNDTPVSFGKISFPAPGEYAYEITEDKGGSSQYEYDETVYRVVWNVSAVTGGYVVERHVYENGSPVNPEMITFKNRFLPDAPGDDIRVRKQITGFDTDEDEAFQFTLALVEAPQGLSSAPMPQAYENLTIRCAFENPSENKMTCTLKGGSLEFYFGRIDFPVNGTYVYEIREVFGNSSSYEYDTSVYTVRYTVSDGNVSKTVTKNGSAYSGSLIQFNNVNLKRPESEYARVDLEVSKTIVGEKYNEDDTFRITLEGISNTAGLAENPMPDDAVGNRKTITIKGEGTQNFGEIVFPAVGNYVYEVKEIHENLDRYEYDDVVYKVTWSVTARSTSSPLVAKMSVEMDGHPETSGNIGFENVKLPEPPAANPEVKKFLNGSTPDIDEYFRFVLKPVSKPEGVDEFPMPYDAEDGVKMVEIKGTGHAHFGGFHFPMDGEYVYEVWEEKGTNPDYDYDSSVYTIFYTVSGKEVEQKIRIGDSVVDDHSLVFENDYLVGSVVVHPRVKKVITRDPGRNDVFTFRLTAKSPDYPMPDGAVNGEIEIEIEGAGEKSFGAITFAEPGKYEYTITEVPSVPTYYFFDTSVYTVIYEVTESSTGEYKITTTVLKDNVKVDTEKFVFTNVFGGTPDEDDVKPDRKNKPTDPSGKVLPKTGFAPGRVTNLPKMRVEYSAYSQLRLMIPGLGVDTEILGVPFVDGDWDVSWLGDNVGWLQNTAWPGSHGAGNTVITGHSTNYLGNPGVFDKLLYLGYGAPVTITAFGEMFTYSVESVDVVYADTPQVLSQKVDFPMLTLITCKFYNEQTGQYDGRVVVKAKLFSVGKVH